jgi:DMATS type aromatic prenyltransferase
MHALSVSDHLNGQLRRLCTVLGMDPATPTELLTSLLGAYGSRPLSEPPGWPCNVADDHSPVEFSVAYNDSEPAALRILAEVPGSPPGVRANVSAAFAFLEASAARFGLSTRRLDAVRDVFEAERPDGLFALWCSLVFRNGRRPEFKVYLNPEVHGVPHAPRVVAESLRRLGLGEAYASMLEHAVRPGELGGLDRLTFFALDLDNGPQARVKLYLSHHRARTRDVARAAGVVDGVDPAAVAEFCAAIGRTSQFDDLPLVGSYTLTEGAAKPVGYSIYIPIRGYVGDDEQARDRVHAVLARHRQDTTLLDRAIHAVTRRPLADGVGLIAHVSLRLGLPRPGVTVYLSTEAYAVAAPRPMPLSAA